MTRPTPSKEWHAFLKDRLPAYISWESYEHNVERLAENRARSEAMGAPRAGASLLQGLLVCERCDNRMTVRYDEQGRHVYLCERLKTNYGGEACQRLAGAPLDAFITRKVLEALEPAALELSLQAAEHVERGRTELDELWQTRLERAGYEAERAGRHYRLLEPENRLVARQLAKDWEEKLAAEQRLREDYERFRHEQPTVLSETEREAIRRLSRDIPALWEAQTTTNAERKQIIRQVVEWIVISVEGVSERVGTKIRWAGGTQTEGVVTRPVATLEQPSYYYPQVCDRVRELAAEGLGPREIAEDLNAEGYRPPKRRESFGRQGVRELMHRLGLVEPLSLSRHRDTLADNEWWLPELARELGMPEVTLYSWIGRGWVEGRQAPAPSKRWILWADSAEVERLRGLHALPRGYHVRKKLWIE